MAAVAAAASSSCLILPYKVQPCPSSFLITSRSAGTSIRRSKCPLAFASTLSLAAFPPGLLSAVEKRRAPPPGRPTVVCEAAPKKYDSATKRARQGEKRRIYNKARKSEIRTRMKKVLESLDELRKKSDAQSEELLPIEKLIAEAFSVIDKAVRVGTLHRNTGDRRKSRLSRRKKAVEIHHGWYVPAAAS
ncbi:30S ribosomal protein S20, chloroplastic-like [Zingiber officinale]|uniref:30S ribosomal protein S20, chloroplastic-like n=1 Tax=Zingiber officinale TaxID=94328 RepID=UPI001C4C01EF|nr:30S ribosomal protein S20, chloroplastic-like [Zingiber officinale]